MTSSDDNETRASVEFTAEEAELVLEELRAMIEELREGGRAATADARRRREDDFNEIDFVCTVRTPAEILADHERRLRVLEGKA